MPRPTKHPITAFQKDQLLDFFFYTMSMEQRRRLMRELPAAYNAYLGAHHVQVVPSQEDLLPETAYVEQTVRGKLTEACRFCEQPLYLDPAGEFVTRNERGGFDPKCPGRTDDRTLGHDPGEPLRIGGPVG